MVDFFPTLGRADIQHLLSTGSITTTDEMESCSRSPFPLWSPVPTATSHISQPGTDPWCMWVPEPAGGATSCLTPLQLHPCEEAATEGRKQKYLPTPLLPAAAELPSKACTRLSVAALRAFLWSLRAKPTCDWAADNHGLYPGEVHSFSGPQSPSQGPPNPVRHLLSR